jgi:flagellar biosynthesis protein FlhG
VREQLLSDWSSSAPGIGATWPGDQAAGLRRLFRPRSPQVVAFTSGGESCGRTTLLVQTALALAAAGHGVLIVDENNTTSNAVAAFGLRARHDLFQVLQGECTLQQALLQVAPLVRVLPAAQAARELDHANRSAAAARRNLATCLQEMQQDVGFVLIDTALRRGGHLSPLTQAARHMAVVVAAQGTAITHAYALIKRIAQERGREGFQVVITRAKTRQHANAIFDNMRRVAREHLDVRLDFLDTSLAAQRGHLAEALLQRLPPAVDNANDSGFVLPTAGLSGLSGLRGGVGRASELNSVATLDSVV